MTLDPKIVEAVVAEALLGAATKWPIFTTRDDAVWMARIALTAAIPLIQRDTLERAAKERDEEIRQLRNQVDDLRSYADACREWMKKSPIRPAPEKEEKSG